MTIMRLWGSNQFRKLISISKLDRKSGKIGKNWKIGKMGKILLGRFRRKEIVIKCSNIMFIRN
jgi:hypothetical protein